MPIPLASLSSRKCMFLRASNFTSPFSTSWFCMMNLNVFSLRFYALGELSWLCGFRLLCFAWWFLAYKGYHSRQYCLRLLFCLISNVLVKMVAGVASIVQFIGQCHVRSEEISCGMNCFCNGAKYVVFNRCWYIFWILYSSLTNFTT